MKKKASGVTFGIMVASLVLGLFFGIPQNRRLYSQNTGFKYLNNYTHKEYGKSPQNWSILQDKRGIIYVGNQGALLEFDGISWRSIHVPHRSVRSMAMDNSGTIYIGGKNEIGFLAPGLKGTLQYVSLVEHLDKNKRDFSNVWKTYCTKEGVYFSTSKYLFRWNSAQKQIKVWEPEHQFKFSFICSGKLFIRQGNVGLMQMDTVGDSLELVPGGELFAIKQVYMTVPYDTAGKKLLIGTRSHGFYLYDGISFVPFPSEADDYLKENQLYHGIRLSTGDFALATLRGGLVVIDPRGNLKEIFTGSRGLQDDNVKYVFEDSHGNLWLALNAGISKIEYASPFSYYDDRIGLTGLVLSVTRSGPHKGLYAGTTGGLYCLAPPYRGRFRPVPGVPGNCYRLLSLGDSLLAATTHGVFQVDNKNNIKQIIIKNASYFLLHSQNKERVWVGTREGLVSLSPDTQNNRWKKEHAFESITQEIRTIAEDKKGNLWLGTLTEGVIKLDFPDEERNVFSGVSPVPYYTAHGLPPGEVHVFFAAGHMMFATEKGIFRFNEEKKAFIPDLTLGNEYADGTRNVFRIAEAKNRHIWIHSGLRNSQAVLRPDGTYVINSRPFLRIPLGQVNAIYPDPVDNGDTIWFAGNDGLIGFDTAREKKFNRDFPVLIRRVLVKGKPVFHGYQDNVPGGRRFYPVIPYKDRNLRFKFAAPFFEAETKTSYRAFLEGYDDGWSDWTLETQKDYTNLDSGRYRFRVQAKNVYGDIGEEAVFQFKVLPPWYKTWWAFLCYTLVSFFFVYLIVRWRSGKLVKEKQKLELIVEERTKEIHHKNLQLEKQTVQLKEQSGKLQEMAKVKSRFFANISHEFRTPLTLIIGPLEQILSDYGEKDMNLEKKVNLMLRNSQRLLTLINQLLELSKFDSGKMRLQAARQNIIPFLKGILASFGLLAAQKKLDLIFHGEEEDITLYFDAEKMEGAICNLLLNALKFTPPGGKITVTVSRREASFLEISVCDTGIGIPGDQLVHIFERFYQAEHPDPDLREDDHKGSGIGLALAKEIINLHHGVIDVHSREGKNSGAEFIIRLPMGDQHLKPHEIVQSSEVVRECRKPSGIFSLYKVDREGDDSERADEQGIAMEAPGEDTDKESGFEFTPESRVDKKHVILVVEDDAEVRNYIREPLKAFCTVVEGKDGKEGVKKAREIMPDLIVSDIMMPGMDGYELCKILKNDINTSHIPVILLTAKASEESIVQGLESGADDYITKPFNTRMLTARIKNLIDLRRQMQLKIQRRKMLLPDEISVSSIDEAFLKELQEIVEKNLSDPEFNIDRLCKELYMGRSTVFSKIEALTGETPKQFIQSYRLERAAQLLKSHFGNVTEVAFEVGFSSSAYFTKCFKEKFHRLPSTFQASETGG